MFHPQTRMETSTRLNSVMRTYKQSVLSELGRIMVRSEQKRMRLFAQPDTKSIERREWKGKPGSGQPQVAAVVQTVPGEGGEIQPAACISGWYYEPRRDGIWFSDVSESSTTSAKQPRLISSSLFLKTWANSHGFYSCERRTQGEHCIRFRSDLLIHFNHRHPLKWWGWIKKLGFIVIFTFKVNDQT